MSIWNEISFEKFSNYLLEDKNRKSLLKIWNKKTKSKEFLSEMENHELSDILVLFQKECILSYNSTCGVSSDQLQDSSHLFSDWIFENKLSGIPSSDEEDYNKMRLISILSKENNLLFNWISESTSPLKTYINSKNEHDPSLSQQEIAAKNKRIIQKHPSLAHLFEQKVVNKKHIQFNNYNEIHKNDFKNEDFKNENIHQIRQSRAMLFFNYSDIGYETKRKCKIYKNKKLTELLIEVSKGELFGGKHIENKENNIIKIIEPIQGYIHSKYVKTFDLNSAQWKFLNHQRSQTIETSLASQSLTLRINNEDLLLPNENESDNENENKEFKPYNENEDEKINIINNNNKSNSDNNMITKILSIEKSKRKAKDVIKLWVSAFNLHDIEILKECYSPNVTSQQFVNQELMTRDPILQCLKQMFNASDDVTIEIKNIIIKQDNVILEFTTFGNKNSISPTNSNNSTNNSTNNTNNSNELLGSHPTKSGLPQKIINGVGIFNVNNGEIMNQKLFWDQDQQWFSDMNVIKMPSSSSITQFLYKNKLAPILNLSDQQLENDSTDHDSSNNNNNNQLILNDINTLNGDNNIIYEMNDEKLAVRGINISDLKGLNKKQSYIQNKNKQMATAIFFIAVGAMFVFIAPKYLGRPKR